MSDRIVEAERIEELKVEIEKLRRILRDAALRRGWVTDETVVRISADLDLLIVEYHKLCPHTS